MQIYITVPGIEWAISGEGKALKIFRHLFDVIKINVIGRYTDH